jgi:hypothetical protein
VLSVLNCSFLLQVILATFVHYFYPEAKIGTDFRVKYHYPWPQRWDTVGNCGTQWDRTAKKRNSKRKSQKCPKNKTDKAASGLSGEIWYIQNNNRHYYNGNYHFGVSSNSKYLLLANRVSLEILHIPMVKHSVLSIALSGFSSYLCTQNF